MERTAFIVERKAGLALSLFTCAESAKVLRGARHYIRKKLNDNTSH
jgi:hypothetical protein